MIRCKRVYERPAKSDGARFLVDRVWPRGVKKDALQLDGWLRDVAPSDGLRKWFGHRPDRWPEFQHRYRAELEAQPAGWRPIMDAARKGPVTLVFSARDEERNNAVVLAEYLNAVLKSSPR